MYIINIYIYIYIVTIVLTATIDEHAIRSLMVHEAAILNPTRASRTDRPQKRSEPAV